MTANSDLKTSGQESWHPADIKAALEKKGWSLSGLSRHHGYHRSAAQRVLRFPWPKMQQFIADAIGVEPSEIWPDRYVAKPTRLKRHPQMVGRKRTRRNGKNREARIHD